MKSSSRVTLLDDQQQKFFGEGPCRLLKAIEVHGSLRAAAISMEMAYSKALRILKHAEDVLGYPLTTRAIGGKDGGGSLLTIEGRRFLSQYEQWRDACSAASQALFHSMFDSPAQQKTGCIIMASGMSRRFGSDKLAADFAGKPLLEWILDATEALSQNRIVLTRSEAAAKICRERNIPVIRHDLPHRNQAIRLGLAALDSSITGCLFCPADQPLVSSESVNRLLCAFNDEPGAIHRLSYGDMSGAPVLFPAWCFPELMLLPEGKGGGVLLKKYPERIRNVQAGNALELKDIDTKEALSELEKLYLSGR